MSNDGESLATERVRFAWTSFDLDSLKRFLGSKAGTLRGDRPIVVDLSVVAYWDPAALLWFSLLQKKRLDSGRSILLRLPDPEPLRNANASAQEVSRASKSAGFLRRWRYDLVLRRLGGLRRTLIENQQNYFDEDKEVYYAARKVADSRGNVHEVVSSSLFPFFDFAALERTAGDAAGNDAGVASPDGYALRISRSAINGKMRSLNEAAIAGVLSKSCSLTYENSLLFSRRVISEVLDNMEMHPNASFGMMAINKNPSKGKLWVAVADDGESICETILPVYNQHHDCNVSARDLREDARLVGSIVDFSTQPEVSSKPNGSGMGLFYIKHHVLKSFGGKLQVLTSGALCEFSSNGIKGPTVSPWRHSWSGNLIRIEIPLDEAGRYHGA